MKILLETSHGPIKLSLNSAAAPKTCANFLHYVQQGHYDNTLFHRVIPSFLIQGGGFVSGMQQKPTAETIENEADNGLKNVRGSIAMARTSDPHSASAQFFINLADNAFLNFRGANADDYGFAVFGEVIEGMDTVDAIAAVTTGRHGPHSDVPQEDVLILSARFIDGEG